MDDHTKRFYKTGFVAFFLFNLLIASYDFIEFLGNSIDNMTLKMTAISAYVLFGPSSLISILVRAFGLKWDDKL